MYNDTNVPKEYLDALRNMASSAPLFPTELVERLTAGVVYEGHCNPRLFFTGWKGYIPGLDEARGSYQDDADLNDIRYAAQWVYFWTYNQIPKAVYVNITTPEEGLLHIGDRFDLANSYIRGNESQEQLNALVTTGFERLQQLIAENN